MKAMNRQSSNMSGGHNAGKKSSQRRKDDGHFLIAGKEGPFVHGGAIVGSGVSAMASKALG